MSEMFRKALPPNDLPDDLLNDPAGDLTDPGADDDLLGGDGVQLPPIDGLSGEDDAEGAKLFDVEATRVGFLDDATSAHPEAGLEIGLHGERSDESGDVVPELRGFADGRVFAEDGEDADDLDAAFNNGASLISLLRGNDDDTVSEPAQSELVGDLGEDDEGPLLPSLGADDVDGLDDLDALLSNELQALPPLESEEPTELPPVESEEFPELPPLEGVNEESVIGSNSGPG